jgi:quercetin dioxygenase-like cupin family protein
MSHARTDARFAALIVGCLLAAVPRVFAAEDARGFVTIKPDEIHWQHNESGPDIAVIYGDPQKEGFYIIRARFAPGVMSRPHYHPNDRHVTVLSGTWWAGTGPNFDPDATTPMPPGSYMKHPAGAVHFDGAKDAEVIVEIKGMGPAPSIPAGTPPPAR